MEYGVPVTELI